MQHVPSSLWRRGVLFGITQQKVALQVEAFQDELNNVSNELRLLQQHTEKQQGGVLVQKG